MKIAVNRIQIDESERIRTDIGNLKSLEESIEKVGLINPLVIDENDMLVAGYRRLQACKNLGIQEVEVVTIDCGGDPLKRLDVEVAENFFRKDFTPEEILSSEVKRQAIVESRRKKGVFERFWLWLKSLFSSSSSVEDRTGGEGKTKGQVEEVHRRRQAEDEEQKASEHSPAEVEQPHGRDGLHQQSAADRSPPKSRDERDRTIKWRES